MLELRWIIENQTTVVESLKKRGSDHSILGALVELDKVRRDLISKEETLRARRNQIAKEIATLKRSGGDSPELMEESKSINSSLGALQDELNHSNGKIREILLGIPNILSPDVPEGKDENENVEILKHGEPKKFDFKVKDHHEIGTGLGILDFERASKIAGARFANIIGKGAKLNRAIISFFLELATEKHGYTEIVPPFMANSKSLTGTTQLPKFAEDLFKIADSDYYLIPTAEVPLTNYYRDEILKEADLPQQFTAYTPCFRSEAGSYGKDTRGIFRQHQFEKVELVWFVHPEKSKETHEALVNHAEEALKQLELPYRKVLICAGDIGFGGAKQYDLEVWLPGQDNYREISSCSNFHDFQARRAGIRFKAKEGGKPQFVHTLNGSGLAVGRTLLAILENYQDENGGIKIPKVLQKYTGFDRIDPQ